MKAPFWVAMILTVLSALAAVSHGGERPLWGATDYLITSGVMFVIYYVIAWAAFRLWTALRPR